MQLCIIPCAGPQEMTPEPHTGTCLGPCGLVGGSLPGLGVAERWANSACGQLQDAMPWERLTWAPAGGQRLLEVWEGEQPGARVSGAQVLEASLRWAAPPRR